MLPLRATLILRKDESEELRRTGLNLRKELSSAKFGKEKEEVWKKLAELSRTILKSKK